MSNMGKPHSLRFKWAVDDGRKQKQEIDNTYIYSPDLGLVFVDDDN